MQDLLGQYNITTPRRTLRGEEAVELDRVRSGKTLTLSNADVPYRQTGVGLRIQTTVAVACIVGKQSSRVTPWGRLSPSRKLAQSGHA